MKYHIIIVFMFVLFSSTVYATTVNYQVDRGGDDGYEEQPWPDLTDNYAYCDFGGRVCAFYFREINVPQGADIIDAYLEVHAGWDQDYNVEIYLANESNASTMAVVEYNITDRLNTTPVSWDESFGFTGFRQSPNISTTIQEVINNANWVQGNNVLVLARSISGNQMQATMYEQNSDYGAKLTIVYETNTVPTITVLNENLTNYSTNTVNVTYSISDDTGMINSSIYLDGNLNATTSTPALSTTLNFTLVGLTEGTHEFYLTGYDDDSAFTQTGTYNFTVDLTNPALNILSPSNFSNFSTAQIDINVSVSDSGTGLKICKWSNNTGQTNNTFTCGSNITGYSWDEGLNEIRVYTEDYAGNTNESSVTFRVDTTAPTVTITSPIQDQTYTITTIDLNFTASDSGVGLDSCWYRNNTDNFNITIDCDLNTTISQAGSGVYIVYVWVNDSLGNIKQANITYSISTDAPAVNLVYPSNNGWVSNSTNLPLNYTALDTDGVGICELWINSTGTWHLNQSFDHGGSTDVTSNFTLELLPEQTFKWNVNCSDGTLSSFAAANFTFTVDETEPYVSFTDYSSLFEGLSFSVDYNISDTNINTCYFSLYNSSGDLHNYAENTSLDCTETGTRSLSLLYYGVFNLTIYGEDYAGNINYTTINFTSVEPPPDGGSGTGGGGGGSGSPSPGVNETEIIESISKRINESTISCGNAICQEGENPLNCPQDCPLNPDEILCIFGSDEPCPAWAFSFMVLVLFLIVIFVIIRNQQK